MRYKHRAWEMGLDGIPPKVSVLAKVSHTGHRAGCASLSLGFVLEYTDTKGYQRELSMCAWPAAWEPHATQVNYDWAKLEIVSSIQIL